MRDHLIGAARMAFLVDEINEDCERWTAGGAAALNPPQEIVPGRWICYLQDTDGN